MMVLPLLILPFATMLFWVLGGGKGNKSFAAGTEKAGFNMLLPNPKLKEDAALDKMSYYDQASADSIKLEEQKKKDPNYSSSTADENNPESERLFDLDGSSWNGNVKGLNTGDFKGDNEHKMYQKLQ